MFRVNMAILPDIMTWRKNPVLKIVPFLALSGHPVTDLRTPHVLKCVPLFDSVCSYPRIGAYFGRKCIVSNHTFQSRTCVSDNPFPGLELISRLGPLNPKTYIWCGFAALCPFGTLSNFAMSLFATTELASINPGSLLNSARPETIQYQRRRLFLNKEPRIIDAGLDSGSRFQPRNGKGSRGEFPLEV